MFSKPGVSALLKKMGIDDPVDAFPVHGACGVWGTIAVGIFATRENIKRAYGFDNDAMRSGNQLRNQVIGILIIITWTIVTSSTLFFPLKWAGLLRVSAEQEAIGLDAAEHGIEARKKYPRSNRRIGSLPSRQSAYGTPSPGRSKDEKSKSRRTASSSEMKPARPASRKHQQLFTPSRNHRHMYTQSSSLNSITATRKKSLWGTARSPLSETNSPAAL
uniref:Ammonium transporter AmtB-like domain-containing protein n=1 Tax=Lotharella globosa TaxID=91324 RepID=A0A6V3MBS4_9EUKA|mmetsp:Transcript_13088/g.26671  ORF Transcript_13088/g.26671 Transcript_13088/m.26671 type:complete len:218 (+) Transcript_13088:1436-2089(+)